MNVFLADEQDLPVDAARLSALARHALETEEVGAAAELSVLFVTRGHIRKLNARYAGNDYATDVLAFPMEDEEDAFSVLGDVVICPDVARANAEQIGHPLERELETLLVHGTLHLLGYDHETPEQRVRMEERMNAILGSFTAPTPI